jgi:hypothetical protein
MPPDSTTPGDPFPRPFPSLPVINPEVPRRGDPEKYGALFYLGLGGLALVLALVGWFGWSAWSLRTVWANVYALHDATRGEAERVQAAYELSRDPRVNQRQLWEIALRKSLPPLARYVVAEALTAEAQDADPRGYGLAVSRSEGWPDWLRLLLTRPMAYASALDRTVDRTSLEELARHPDPAVALWARFALSAGTSGDASDSRALRQAATTDGPARDLAILLVRALDAHDLTDRLRELDAATVWLRRNHPGSATVWAGWDVRGGLLIPGF